MPITDLLSCVRVFDKFESLSPAQRHHAKTYATGLVAGNKTVAGIAREVIPAKSKQALNKFLTEYDWHEQEFNHEGLEELQKHGETRWSKNGYIILDDTITEKAGDESAHGLKPWGYQQQLCRVSAQNRLFLLLWLCSRFSSSTLDRLAQKFTM